MVVEYEERIVSCIEQEDQYMLCMCDGSLQDSKGAILRTHGLDSLCGGDTGLLLLLRDTLVTSRRKRLSLPNNKTSIE